MQISPAVTTPPETRALWEKAQQLEAGFIAEMLRHAGLQANPGAFGGGAGEEQFASFMREAQAQAIVEAGGIGLARQVFDALVERSGI